MVVIILNFKPGSKTKFPNNPFRHFFDLKYDYLVSQVNDTICEKRYTFHIKCDIPALKRPIERLTKKIILENRTKALS